MHALFKRPWWGRVWIRQEVALSNIVTLVCGDKTLSMDVLGPLLATFEYVQGLGYVPPFPIHQEVGKGSAYLPWTFHADQLLGLRGASNNGYTWVELHRLLPETKACKATDPRDTVFSTIGLSNPKIFDIKANYRQDLKAVLLEATKTVLKKEYGLPSWIPDLSEPWQVLPFKRWKGGEVSSHFYLCVSDSTDVEAEVTDECLTLRGNFINSIALLSDRTVTPNVSSEKLDKVFQSWKTLCTAAKNKQLDEVEEYEFISGNPNINNSNVNEHLYNWVRFLSVMSDKADDLKGFSYESKQKKVKPRTKRDISAKEVLEMADEEQQTLHPHYHHMNNRLSRAWFVPSKLEPYPVRYN